MNLLNGVCPVKGAGRGGLHTFSKLFRDGSSQAGAKVVTGTRGKIFRF